jgi:hypothetical protein
VDPNLFPTTVEFFERLPSEIKKQRLFQLALAYLHRESTEQIIDIEKVLWALEELIKFLKSTQTGEGLIGYLLKADRLAKVVNSGFTFGHLVNVYNELIPELTSLVSNTNALVYDLYGESPALTHLSRNWVPFLNKLFGKSSKLDIFTTNYDVIIETALEIVDPSSFNSYLGVTGGRHKMLDLKVWEASSAQAGGLLTKLHGSVDWKIRNDRIYVGDPLFTGDHAKQGIIYPGFKGKEGAIFLKPFHDYLDRSLSEAGVVVFIGFAFRDEYINDSIRNNLAPDAQVIVINPDKSVKFPYPRAKVRHSRRGFDFQAVLDVEDAVELIKPKRTIRKI